MARPAATDAQRREQRDRIRRAAAEIYQEGGLPALSVRAVAKRAGVSTGLLYSYFDGLSELMRTLWIRPVGEFGRLIEAIAADEPDPLARIEALLLAYVQWAEANPDVYRGVLLFVRPPNAEAPPTRPVADLALPRVIAAAIEEGQRAGLVRPGHPMELAQALWAGAHGALALPVNIHRYDITPAAELAPVVIAALLRSLEPTPSEAQP